MYPNIPITDEHIQRAGKPEVIEASVVIGADGVRHGVASMVGLPAPSRIMSGIQFEVQMQTIRQDFVELFLGTCAPGFFAWEIPLSDGIARFGLATDNLASQDSLSYLCELRDKLSKKGRVVDGMLDFVVGGIPIGVAARTFSDGVLICGDAAGQVKPTSGGGVYTGAVCAKIAGEVAAKAAFENDTSQSRLEEYEIGIGNEYRFCRIHRCITRNHTGNSKCHYDTMVMPAVQVTSFKFTSFYCQLVPIFLHRNTHLPEFYSHGM